MFKHNLFFFFLDNSAIANRFKYKKSVVSNNTEDNASFSDSSINLEMMEKEKVI